ncbi:MAG: hypothetical protein KME26_30890 [Oscillatoria princeps RMCB-10]|nr:hypothetical protein [Oscillatoria princeps RMCB-10]
MQLYTTAVHYNPLLRYISRQVEGDGCGAGAIELPPHAPGLRVNPGSGTDTKKQTTCQG